MKRENKRSIHHTAHYTNREYENILIYLFKKFIPIAFANVVNLFFLNFLSKETLKRLSGAFPKR
jgi:hypothetical protein